MCRNIVADVREKKLGKTLKETFNWARIITMNNDTHEAENGEKWQLSWGGQEVESSNWIGSASEKQKGEKLKEQKTKKI